MSEHDWKMAAACVALLALSLRVESSGSEQIFDRRAAAPVSAPTTREPAFYETRFKRTPTVAEMTDLGKRMFFDAGLSESGRLSCATCHDPAHAFAPANNLPVQRAGADGSMPGLRAVPSLRYLQSVPPFTEHMHDAEGDDSIDQGPAGGRTWDGRAQTAHDQARLPLLSAREMANKTPEAVVAKLRRAAYAGALREAFGADVLDNATTGFNAALLSLEVFQQTPQEFYPYDSRYDAYLRDE